MINKYIRKYFFHTLFLLFGFSYLAQTTGEVVIGKQLLYFDSVESSLHYSRRLDSLYRVANRAIVLKAPMGLADCFRRIGIVHENFGRLDSAINSYIVSARIAKKNRYTLSEASSLNQVGCVYSELKNNDKAFLYFKKAFDLYKRESHRRGMSDASLNIAEVYYDDKNNKAAEDFCLQSLYVFRTLKDTSGTAYHYHLLSRIYTSKEDMKLAVVYAEAAVSAFRKSKEYEGLFPGLIQLAELYHKTDNAEKVFALYLETNRLAAEQQTKKWIAESNRLLSKYYEGRKIYDSALVYFNLYSLYNDSLINEKIADATINAMAHYDAERKDMELLIKQKLIEDSYYLNLALAILTILLLITILVIIRNFSQRKKIVLKESELQNANAMLMGQDEERERIARELHDRVGSMLSTVKLHFTSMEEHMSELLKMQGKSYHQAIELLDETYEEVRRISHDLDTGLLGRFGLRTAMMQLAQVLESTNKLKVLYLDNDLDPQVYKAFETDLYRITQELLSNTIKYAQAKEISIQLSRTNGNLVYSYEDDGIGFIKEELQNSKGIGYKNIDTRVQRMKGTWHLDTNPGNGLNLIIELPVNGNTHHHS